MGIDSSLVAKKPHAVCIPYPAQSHINAMLKLAKLLHFKGFHITFVNTEFNHQRILRSRGPDSLNGLPDFRFETIPDGLPPSDINATQDIPALCESITKNALIPIRNLIVKLNETSTFSDYPPVTRIVSDGCMTITLEAAEELGIPGVIFWPAGSSIFISYLHAQRPFEKGLLPLKEKSCSTNGYLDTPMNLIPGMRDIRLRDLPSFFYDGNDFMHNYLIQEVQRVSKACAIIFNTFDVFESEVLHAIKMSILPPIYPIGPLHLLPNNQQLKSLGCNLWKEDEECLKWLDSKQPNSVVYVNFGSITVMTSQQLIEFAWGLANSQHPFLLVIRPDLVIGEAAILPREFTKETASRSMISSWCPQEQVLCHSSIGGFLTHSGWNSIMDTVCGGVPIISWPFFGDQQTNCRYACVHWGIGMEIDNNVKRDEVYILVRELMEGEKGKKMKIKAMEWKKSAEESTKPGGSSYVNFDKVLKEMLV